MKYSPLVIWTDIQSFFQMAWAILRGRYKMPWGTFFWGLLCLAYVLSPIDVLPDVLPLLGITDDGAFIILVCTLLHKDLVSFRNQQQQQANIIEAEIIKPDTTRQNKKEEDK